MRHPEALLLIDDDQSQVLELDILLDEPMGSNDDIDLAGGQVGQHLILIAMGAEARKHVDDDGEWREPFLEAFIVLLRQNRGRNEHSNLFSVHHGLECRAKSHFSFAVAHIAANQPIHGARLLHIGLHVIQRRQLIEGFHVGECIL